MRYPQETGDDGDTDRNPVMAFLATIRPQALAP
jgi:hypothetical protein